MSRSISVRVLPSTPTMAIVAAFVLGLTQPFFACLLYLGISQSWEEGEHLAACVLAFFLLAEFIMIPACWLGFFWFVFGRLCLEAEEGCIRMSRWLFGFSIKDKPIPLNAQSYFRLMERRVMPQTLKPQMSLGRSGESCMQTEYELGVADAQKFHSIMSFHERRHAWELLQELHRLLPALPADENGQPVHFRALHQN